MVVTTATSTQTSVVKPTATAAKPSPIPLTVYNLSQIKVQEIPNPTIRKFQEEQSDTQPCHSRNTIFLVYGRDPNLPLHQLLEQMQQFLGDQESGLLNLEAHQLAIAIVKNTK